LSLGIVQAAGGKIITGPAIERQAALQPSITNAYTVRRLSIAASSAGIPVDIDGRCDGCDCNRRFCAFLVVDRISDVPDTAIDTFPNHRFRTKRSVWKFVK